MGHVFWRNISFNKLTWDVGRFVKPMNVKGMQRNRSKISSKFIFKVPGVKHSPPHKNLHDFPPPVLRNLRNEVDPIFHHKTSRNSPIWFITHARQMRCIVLKKFGRRETENIGQKLSPHIQTGNMKNLTLAKPPFSVVVFVPPTSGPAKITTSSQLGSRDAVTIIDPSGEKRQAVK